MKSLILNNTKIKHQGRIFMAISVIAVMEKIFGTDSDARTMFL
jgi:hypothetical protein